MKDFIEVLAEDGTVVLLRVAEILTIVIPADDDDEDDEDYEIPQAVVMFKTNSNHITVPLEIGREIAKFLKPERIYG